MGTEGESFWATFPFQLSTDKSVRRDYFGNLNLYIGNLWLINQLQDFFRWNSSYLFELFFHFRETRDIRLKILRILQKQKHFCNFWLVVM